MLASQKGLPSHPTTSRTRPSQSARWYCCKASQHNQLRGYRQAFGDARPQSAAVRAKTVTARANKDNGLQAVLFDCDGVLVDTERDGHRVSFNRTFAEKGLQHEWDVDLYGELLEIGGGKERMTKYFKDCADREPFLTMKDEAQRWEFVSGLHKRKTDIFMAMVESGAMPLRPGVKRLFEEAMAAGVTVAVCSTSNEKAVTAIVRTMLGDSIAAVTRIFAGDIVPKKKPDPAIYLLAAKELNLDPARCVVVEDSRIGLLAAKAAGMRCVVTRSSYTQNEDFSTADAVFDCIGDKGDERFSLNDLAALVEPTAAAA